MPYHETLLYENTDELKFNMEYFVKNWVPQSMDRLAKYGLKGINVVEYKPGPLGPKPQFLVGATLIWESEESVEAALASDDFQVISDNVKNYSNMRSVLQGGSVVCMMGETK